MILPGCSGASSFSESSDPTDSPGVNPSAIEPVACFTSEGSSYTPTCAPESVWYRMTFMVYPLSTLFKHSKLSYWRIATEAMMCEEGGDMPELKLELKDAVTGEPVVLQELERADALALLTHAEITAAELVPWGSNHTFAVALEHDGQQHLGI